MMILDIAGFLMQIVLAPIAILGLPLVLIAMGKMLVAPVNAEHADPRSASRDRSHLALVKTDSVDPNKHAA